MKYNKATDINSNGLVAIDRKHGHKEMGDDKEDDLNYSTILMKTN